VKGEGLKVKENVTTEGREGSTKQQKNILT